MAKKKKGSGIDLANIESNLDEVLAALHRPPHGSPAGSGDLPAAAPPPVRLTAAERPKPAGGEQLTPPTAPNSAAAPPPATEAPMSAAELAWFFQPPGTDDGTTQVYLNTATKEALFAVARRVGGIPAGQLADNIIRWWIINNRPGLKKLMHRDPLDRLEL